MPVGISWRDWVGYTLDDAATTPYTATGAVGTGQANPTHFLPLAGEESVAYDPAKMFSPSIATVMAPIVAQDGSRLIRGTIPTVIPIGCFGTAGAGKLYDWAYNMTEWPAASGDPKQLPSATLWICTNYGQSTYVLKKIYGAKIARVSIESPEGASWVTMSLDIIGRSMETVTSISSFPSPTTLISNIYGSSTAIVPEYSHLDAYMKSARYADAVWNPTPGSLTPGTDYDYDALGWSLAWDNKIDESGFRKDGTGLIRRCYNLGREVTGSFSKDFRSVTEFGNFLLGTEMQVGLLLARSASKYLKLEMPRVTYATGGANSAGVRESFNKEAYSWRSLACLASRGSFTLGDDLVLTEVNS